jgi:small nuclear ribonucleoprotein (snRNP)-like protein
MNVKEFEILKEHLHTNVMVWLLESSNKLGAHIEEIEASMNVLKILY